MVDFLIESNSQTAINSIRLIRPSIFCKGPDYKNHNNDITGKINEEVSVAKKVRSKVYYTSGIIMSSSKIINKYFNNLNDSQSKFINKIKKVSNFNKILKHINDMKKSKILVIGEIIIDEYIFCQAVGKSGKESVLVIQPKKNERYLGGICQIANNLSSFSDNVTLLSTIGISKKETSFINKNLNRNITKNLFIDKTSKFIIKSRYIDIVNQNKLLGVYDLEENPITKTIENKIQNSIKKIIKKFDIFVFADYGHGLITDEIAKIITSKSRSFF